jgi:hypothetical protein
MSHATSPSLNRQYSVVRVCEEWGLARSTFYHQQGHVAQPPAHDGTITTERPNQMWGTDATSTVTLQDGPVTVFVGVD